MENYNQIASQFEEWLINKSLLANTTIGGYTRWVGYFLNYLEAFNINKLNDIDNEIIYQFTHFHRDKKTGQLKHYSEACQKSRISALDLFFSWTYEKGYSRENPATRYKKSLIKPIKLAEKEGHEDSNEAIDILLHK